jgi:hypothetical protein
VIFAFRLNFSADGNNLPGALLPLDLAGCTTMAIFVLHWFAGVVVIVTKVPSNTRLFPKERK